MKLGQQYTGTIKSFEKEGRGFTSDTGTKYSTYRIWLEEFPVSYLASIRSSVELIEGTTINFIFSLDKRKKFRLKNIEFEKPPTEFMLSTSQILAITE